MIPCAWFCLILCTPQGGSEKNALCVLCGERLKLSDFDYDLPPALIAQYPPAERGASRLLHLDGDSGEFTDRWFRGLPELMRAGDVLVMNDTRVIKARLTGHKESGGQVEVLIERVLDHERAIAMVRASKS